MKFKVKSSKWNKVEADILVLFVSQDDWQKQVTQVNQILSGELIRHALHDDFKGKEGQMVSLPTFGKLPVYKIIVVGLGVGDELSLSTLRKGAAKVSRQLKSREKNTVAIDLSSELVGRYNAQELAKTIVEGISLGSYLFVKYKSEERKEPKSIGEVYLLYPPARLQHGANGIKEGEIFSEATIFARDLVNEAPTVTTPTFLTNIAKTLAKRGVVSTEVLEESHVRKLGMNAFLAVSRGSDEPPKFIKLTYKGGKRNVVIAGKAITFDTGGLSLKDAKNMETMKLDMAGAAAVLGIFSVLPQLKPKVTVVGLIAATENMPGAKASKPGDIVTSYNGKTIEILNTDAEGRLTLADVLAYGAQEKPEYIIDLATLTGACMVALGEEIAGLFSNNKDLTQKLLTAGSQAGEKLWELPLEKEYKESVKSDIADLRNISKSRYGGAITAALFLEEFVDKIPWAHVDIAGPAFEEKDTPIVPKGGSGFGVRTLLNFLMSL